MSFEKYYRNIFKWGLVLKIFSKDVQLCSRNLNLMDVGTPGLGYPLLLCLGKSLVIILDYVQTAGPLRSGALFTR